MLLSDCKLGEAQLEKGTDDIGFRAMTKTDREPLHRPAHALLTRTRPLLSPHRLCAELDLDVVMDAASKKAYVIALVLQVVYTGFSVLSKATGRLPSPGPRRPPLPKVTATSLLQLARHLMNPSVCENELNWLVKSNPN